MNQQSQQLASRRKLGHVYVIQFSSGLLKVGLTKNATKRMKAHRDTAHSQRQNITQSWVSSPHVNFTQNEQRLIDFCTERYGSPFFGKETFQEADFDGVVAFAASFQYLLSDEGVAEVSEARFEGQVVYTVLIEGEPHVVLRPTLVGIGIDFSAQFKKLQGRSWAARTMGQCVATAADGKARSMVTISLEGWSMLLANIDENRVNPDAAALVVAFQQSSAAALSDFWNDRYSFRALPQQLALEGCPS